MRAAFVGTPFEAFEPVLAIPEYEVDLPGGARPSHRRGLSGYLDRVRRGERVVITRHGAPVAMLQPLVIPQLRLADLPALLASRRRLGESEAKLLGDDLSRARGELYGVRDAVLPEGSVVRLLAAERGEHEPNGPRRN